MVKPTLADVHCSPMRFVPGDRLLVRTYAQLDRDQRDKLHKAIQKWAGPDVEVLIYCALDMEITLDKSRRLPTSH